MAESEYANGAMGLMKALIMLVTGIVVLWVVMSSCAAYAEGAKPGVHVDGPQCCSARGTQSNQDFLAFISNPMADDMYAWFTVYSQGWTPRSNPSDSFFCRERWGD